MRGIPVALVLVTLIGCDVTDVEPVAPAPGVEEADVPAPARESTRMTVQQLERSVPVVSEGAVWTVTVDDTDYAVFDVLAPTLGSPDYIRVTDEPAVPNALYVKFMTDMARNVCGQMRDGGTLVRTNDVDENLRHLHLRFYGERVTDDSQLTGLKNIFETAKAEDGSDAYAWYSVCVAMVTSPAFHIY